MSNREKRPLLFFGAGASAFAGGVAPTDPPVGPRLFEELCHFDSFFSSIPEDLREQFSESFEAGMAHFARRESGKLTTFLQKMGLYFLQFRVASAKENFHCRMLTLFREKQMLMSMSLATLNYDLLLEDAILGLGFATNWQSIPLVKVHGSPNFILDDSVFRVGSLHYGGTLPTEALVDIPTRAVSREEAKDALQRTSFAPAMSLFAEGKKAYFSPSFVNHHYRAFVKFVENASSITIVGINLHEPDAHIWNPIAASGAPIGIVNLDSGFALYRDWAAARPNVLVHHICPGVSQAVSTHSDSFCRFIASGRLQ